MFYVYILKSIVDSKLYIGYSPDLRERVRRHNKGSVRSTRNKRPWKLIYYEAYIEKQDAIERERKLKQFKNSYAHLKKRIKYSLQT